MVKSNVADYHMGQGWWTLVVRANYCNTETWIRKYLSSLLCHSLIIIQLKTVLLKPRLVLPHTILKLSNLQI